MRTTLRRVIENSYIFLDLTTLQGMLTDALTARTNILNAHQAYTAAGKSFSRAELKAVQTDIAAISFAIDQKSGTSTRTVYADMSGGNGSRPSGSRVEIS